MASGLSELNHQALCKYLVGNTSSRGELWPFAHDFAAKPNRICRFYVGGKCFHGSRCRFDHVRPAASNKNVVKIDTSVTDGTYAADFGLSLSRAARPEEYKLSPKAKECIPSRLMHNDPSEIASGLDTGKMATSLFYPYFETGLCKLTGNCQFMHGDLCNRCNLPLNPSDVHQRAEHRNKCIALHEEAVKDSIAEARSAEKICGICMENIREKNVWFGILESCKHCFCLDCIRRWRGSRNEHFEKKIVRSCPECRIHSDFIVPAKYWVEDDKEKLDLIKKFRENAKKKQCKYVRNGSVNNCPFGNKCFYKHAMPDGTIVCGKSPRLLARRRTNYPIRMNTAFLFDSDSDDETSLISELAEMFHMARLM